MAVLVLALSVLVFAFGFYSNQLLSQEIWTPAGLRQFLWVLGLSSAWLVAGRILFPSRVLRISFLAAFGYGVFVVGAVPFLAVFYLLFSAWCLGRIFRLDGALAVAAGICIYAWIIGVLVLLPANYLIVYVLLFTVAPLVQLRTIRVSVQQPANLTFFIPIALLALIHFLIALKLEVSQDGLAMHLAIPASVATHHQYPIDPRDTAWAVMPMMGDWSFTAAYVLGGESAARLFNLSFLFILAFLINRSLRDRVDVRSRYLLVALFLSSPIAGLVTGSLFVENFWAMCLFTAFLLCAEYWTSARIETAVLASVLLGIGLATKFGSIVMILPLAGFLVFSAWRHRQARWIPLFGGLFLILGGAHYARAYWETGNPIFPFINNVFKSPYFDSTAAFVDTRFRKPISLTTLYDLTFRTGDFLEAQSGGWAFQYLLLLPLAVVGFLRKRDVVGYLAWGASIVFCLITFTSTPNARYLYPALPLFTLLLGSGFSTAYRWVVGVSVILIGLNVYFLPASGWYQKDFVGNAFTDRERYLEQAAPVRLLVARLNETHPGESVAFLGNSQIAGLIGKAYSSTWHHPRFNQRLRSLQSADSCLQFLNELGIGRLIVPVELKRMPHPPNRFFSLDFSAPEMVAGGWKIVRILPHEGERPAPPFVLQTGTHNDSDEGIVYRGQWTNDYLFSAATEASVTYSADPGATAQVVFSGREIVLVFTKASNRGLAEIFIDGVSRGTIDGFSPDVVWQSKAVFGGLSEGRHTFELRVLGKSAQGRQDHYFDVDALIVR